MSDIKTVNRIDLERAYDAVTEAVGDAVSCGGAPLLNATLFNAFEAFPAADKMGTKAGRWAENFTGAPFPIDDVAHVTAYVPTAAVTGVLVAIKNVALSIPAAVDFGVVKPLQGKTDSCSTFNTQGNVWKLPKLISIMEK